jgi:hypothetical protein
MSVVFVPDLLYLGNSVEGPTQSGGRLALANYLPSVGTQPVLHGYVVKCIQGRPGF